MPTPPAEPPQRWARGGRRKLDLEWLTYVTDMPVSLHVATPTPPPQLGKGTGEFNAGLFFESHETWEDAWQATAYPQRLFFLALTKIAAGFAHAQRGNVKGARRLLNDGLRFLRPFTPACMGLDTQRLSKEVQQWMDSPARETNTAYPHIHVESL